MEKKWYALIIVIISVALAAIILSIPSEAEVLRLSVGHGAHYSQLIIAVEKGFIQELAPNLEIELSMIKSGPEKVEAMVAGQLDFGVMGTPPAVIGVSKDVGLKILLSQGKALRCLWTWREDIDSIEDLQKGDKINLVGTGTAQYVSMTKAFQEIGRTRDELDEMIVAVSHADAYQLMEQREIDGEFASGDWNWKYEDKPEYKCIISEADIWEVPTLVLMGSVEYAEEHPEAVEAMIEGFIDAQNFISENPEEAMQIVADFYGWDEPTTFKGIEFDYTHGLLELPEVADTMFELGIIDKELTESDLLFEETLEVLK